MFHSYFFLLLDSFVRYVYHDTNSFKHKGDIQTELKQTKKNGCKDRKESETKKKKNIIFESISFLLLVSLSLNVNHKENERERGEHTFCCKNIFISSILENFNKKEN